VELVDEFRMGSEAVFVCWSSASSSMAEMVMVATTPDQWARGREGVSVAGRKARKTTEGKKGSQRIMDIMLA